MYLNGSKLLVLRDKNRGDSLIESTPTGPGFPTGPAFQPMAPGPGAPGNSGLTPELQVSVETATKSVVEDIAHEPSVVAVAESMPIALIQSVEDSELETHEIHGDSQGASSASDVTWGVEAVGADNALLDGSRAVVAVLDTGIDASHPAFDVPDLELVQKNFTSGSATDDHGHGTHCAGTIFGRDVDGVRIGVAPGVRKALIGKVIGSGAGTGELIDAMQWAADGGANIISMSLGFDFPKFQGDLEAQGVPQKAATSMALQAYRNNIHLFDQWMALNKASAALGKATIVVAAAGNESRRNAAIPFEIATSSPAAANSVVSVGALSMGSEGLGVASFSNTGPKISGPGVSVLSAQAGGGLTSMNGTSMACPHVAGVAALLWHDMADSPIQPTPDRVIARLLANAQHSGLFAPGTDFADVGVGIARSPA